MVQQFQYLGWASHRDVPASKRSFLKLILQVEKWQEECEEGEGRTIIHCLWVTWRKSIAALQINSYKLILSLNLSNILMDTFFCTCACYFPNMKKKKRSTTAYHCRLDFCQSLDFSVSGQGMNILGVMLQRYCVYCHLLYIIACFSGAWHVQICFFCLVSVRKSFILSAK